MKKLTMFFIAGLMFSIAACGGGSAGTAAPAGTGTTATSKPAFYTGTTAILEGEYFVTATADVTTVPPAAYSHAYGSVTSTGTAVNELPVTVTGSPSGNSYALTVTSPTNPNGVPNSKSVVIDFGTQAVHKLIVLDNTGPALGWGLQCNTDTNCITGPITYGTVPNGVNVTELKNGGGASGSNVTIGIGTVFIMTTTGSGTVDKVGWTIYQSM